MPRKVKLYSPKRRAIYFEAGDSIDRLAIYERDGWICGLCGKPVNKHLRHPDWRAATLDHVIPLSVAIAAGWPPAVAHSPDNLQLAHKRCNELKSNDCDLSVEEIMAQEYPRQD